MIGNEIHDFASRLWPINRSVTGEGVRQTLELIGQQLPELTIHEVASGTEVFDWLVPKEWRIREAWIKTPEGKIICDFKKNNLHLVSYSTPIHTKMSLKELDAHFYSLADQPNAVPYVTSYYSERWGFCISQEERDQLKEGNYEVFVDSELFDGSLTYGELIIPGQSSDEVFLSTYVCHPSMANNELSGPTVTTFIARWIKSLPQRRYTYRIVFIPETIGSITYLSRNLNTLQERTIAGFNITCIGDNRNYSYLPSRQGDTLSDTIVQHVLGAIEPDFKRYSWLDRGSDERQYCAPMIDLPIASIMRTKYGEYPEYHTSLDDLETVVTPEGLEGGYNAVRRCVEALEMNHYLLVKVLGEPQLGKRGLYPSLSTKGSGLEVRLMMNMLSFADGKKSLVEIANLCKTPIWSLYPIVEQLVAHGLLEKLNQPTVAC